MAHKTIPLSFRLRPEVKKALQDLAEADRRSLTNYIEVILERHIEAAQTKGKAA